MSRLVLCILTAIAMVAVGGVVAAVHAPVAQAADSLACSTGLIYGITESSGSTSDDTGTLYQYNTKSSPMKPASIGKWTGLTDDDQWVNGLGIGIGGAVVYAYGRGDEGTGTGNKYNAKILIYTPSTGIWDSTSGPSIDTTSTKKVAFIAGAVDLKTGNYLLGGYDTNGDFQLYKYTPGGTTIDYVGSLDTSRRGAMNGDMAFDSVGNLYVLASQYPVAISGTGGGGHGHGGGGGQPQFGASMNIFKINAGDLTKAINSPGKGISFTTPSTAKIAASSGFNGLAFDGDGSVWVSNSNTMLNFDASTWKQKGQTQNITDANTDLATCLSPATLTIQKNVVGRADASDQFTLSVTNADTAIQPATTTGSSTGIQTDQIGPTPVVVNTTYNFAEAMASDSASAMSAYSSTWQCTAPSPYNVNVSGTGASGSVTVPATIDPTGAAITCVFTNTPKPGGVEWAKQDSTTAALLVGSEWKITGPVGPSSKDMAVTDCVGSSAAACAGTNDVNFVAGEFEVDGLTPGSYTLTETKAPAGYALDPTVRQFTVGSDGMHDFGVITNQKLSGSVTWEKIDEGDPGSHLAGSQWVLAGPDVPANTIVGDCTISGSCGSGAYADQDARPGYFKLSGLASGDYTLKESKAPAGYVLSAASYPFTISASNLTPTINDGNPITNTQQAPPTLPLTGGMSTDAFLIGGSALMVLSAGLAVALRRKGLARV